MCTITGNTIPGLTGNHTTNPARLYDVAGRSPYPCAPLVPGCLRNAQRGSGNGFVTR